MKPEDIKVGMEFGAVDFCSYYGVVEGIDGEYALFSYWTCFEEGRTKELLTLLADESVFKRIDKLP